MKTIDKNHDDDHRPMQNSETDYQVASGGSTYKNDDNNAISLAVSYPPTSFVNDSARASTTLEAPLSVVTENVSIFNVLTSSKRKLILAISSIVAVLLPFCDTIYLPALNTIEKDLNTTATLVGISVSIYLFMNGIFSLVWGSLSDRFGRKIIILVALIIFMTASIVCIFAPNIAVLIVFRALQGAAVSALLVASQGIVSDIYPAEIRGKATGIFFVPFLLGPVIGPLIGGGLSGTLGWRSTFVLLSILSFIILLIVFVLVPETHQYFVKEQFHKANPNKRIVDAVPNDKPKFKPFWKPLIFLADLTILPYIVMSTATFAAMFICFVIFPLYLDETPYNYNEIIIGVLFIPAGVAMFVGSLLGGRLSDMASRHYGGTRCPESRLVPAVAFSFLIPMGLIIFGWTFHYQLNVTGPIIALTMVSFSRSIIQPCIFAYLTVKKQSEAAGASATNTVLNFCAAGVGVTIAVPLKTAIGVGPFFSAICAINLATIVVAIILIYKQIKRAGCIASQENDIALESVKPNGNIVASMNGQSM